jgi:hypothetical protein
MEADRAVGAADADVLRRLAAEAACRVRGAQAEEGEEAEEVEAEAEGEEAELAEEEEVVEAEAEEEAEAQEEEEVESVWRGGGGGSTHLVPQVGGADQRAVAVALDVRALRDREAISEQLRPAAQLLHTVPNRSKPH